jgi:hypothetical protein
VRWSPAKSASFSCEIPVASRILRTFCPNRVNTSLNVALSKELPKSALWIDDSFEKLHTYRLQTLRYGNVKSSSKFRRANPMTNGGGKAGHGPTPAPTQDTKKTKPKDGTKK